MLDTDFEGLPENTRSFVKRVSDLGLDRMRIHGLFVLLGFCAAGPKTEEAFARETKTLQEVVPYNRSRNIDELVGDFFPGYEKIVNEFCFRTGFPFDFREIKIQEKAISIINLQDEGLLDPSIDSVDQYFDAPRLFDRTLEALGQPTTSQNRSLIESFMCGSFQACLYGHSDVKGTVQIAEAIKATMPLFIGRLFQTLTHNNIDYFLGLLPAQITLLELMQSMAENYVQQMWGFQSHLFFDGQIPIADVNDTDPAQWHSWVLNRAHAFDRAYPEQLIPFSRSETTLSGIPIWKHCVENFDHVDTYIDGVWGIRSDKIRNAIDLLEYKALLVHVIYASLTSSRETFH